MRQSVQWQTERRLRGSHGDSHTSASQSVQDSTVSNDDVLSQANSSSLLDYDDEPESIVQSVPSRSITAVSRRAPAASIQDDSYEDEEDVLDLGAPGAYAVSRVDSLERLRLESDSAWDPTDQSHHSIGMEQRLESAGFTAATQTDVENDAANDSGFITTNDTAGEYNHPGDNDVHGGHDRKVGQTRKYLLCLVVSIVLGACVVGLTLGLFLPAQSTTVGTNSTPSDGCNTASTQEDIHLQCKCTGRIQVSGGSRGDHIQNVYNMLLATEELADFVDQKEMQLESCASKNRALVWLALEIADAEDSGVTYPYRRIQDRVVIASIFEGMGGRNWNSHTNWLSNTSVCSWFGLGCDQEGLVTSFSLPNNHVEGSLETILGLLQDLITLNLSQNLLFGSIPQSIWNLPHLGEKKVHPRARLILLRYTNP